MICHICNGVEGRAFAVCTQLQCTPPAHFCLVSLKTGGRKLERGGSPAAPQLQVQSSCKLAPADALKEPGYSKEQNPCSNTFLKYRYSIILYLKRDRYIPVPCTFQFCHDAKNQADLLEHSQQLS